MNKLKTISGDAEAIMKGYTERARVAMRPMASARHKQRQEALERTAVLIRAGVAELLKANEHDLTRAKTSGVKESFINRLTLTDERIEAMAKGLEDIASLPDPLGQELSRWQMPNGLDIARVSTPLGVLGVIYESRPNVTIDAAGLSVKSGNSVILRCGSDSFSTSTMLASLMRQGLEGAGLPSDAVQLVDSTDRALVGAMLGAVGGIDVIVPRGGRSLVERVQHEARVPVFAHLEGICHLYIDKGADPKKAEAIAVNAKMRRVEICGALETLLVDKAIAPKILPAISSALNKAGCSLRADEEALALIENAELASEADWTTEYLDAIVSIALVNGVDGAIEHIDLHGSGHTESIITEDSKTAEQFLSEVSSAIVMVNASTQFADGGEFGMGAEIGIATGRLHARGPVGAAQLTSFKYIVRGQGQTRP